MDTQFNGNFGLFIIDKISRRNNFYEIKFQNTKQRFAGVNLHCFMDDKGTAKSLTDLKSGDGIWLDISAYTADKSLFNYIGAYSRAIKYNKK